MVKVSTILENSTVRADVAHLFACCAASTADVRYVVRQSIGLSAIDAADAGAAPDSTDIARLVRSARYRKRIARAAARDARARLAYLGASATPRPARPGELTIAGRRAIEARAALADLGAAIVDAIEARGEPPRACPIHGSR